MLENATDILALFQQIMIMFWVSVGKIIFKRQQGTLKRNGQNSLKFRLFQKFEVYSRILRWRGPAICTIGGALLYALLAPISS